MFVRQTSGGATNVKLGLKDLTNREAQDRYVDECTKMLDDINTRFVRARLAHLSRDDADNAYARIKDGETVEGIRRDDRVGQVLGRCSRASRNERRGTRCLISRFL